jgi:hypothetical protein
LAENITNPNARMEPNRPIVLDFMTQPYGCHNITVCFICYFNESRASRAIP